VIERGRCVRAASASSGKSRYYGENITEEGEQDSGKVNIRRKVRRASAEEDSGNGSGTFRAAGTRV
jgi:hypothetical protein